MDRKIDVILAFEITTAVATPYGLAVVLALFCTIELFCDFCHDLCISCSI